jgi:ribosomal protein S18 acetylase RimI-like enzyme
LVAAKGFYTWQMVETRVATEADAELITEQRRKMFVEMGRPEDECMRAMLVAFAPWVRKRLRDGQYLGWLVEQAEQVVAGGGMFLMDFPPHFRDPQPLRAYLLNFYVAPEARGRGLAHGLLKTAVGEARRRGIRVVSLHASEAGRPLYERNGFVVSNEMMLNLDTEAVP